MKYINRKAAFIAVGGGLGAALAASSGHLARALLINQSYLLAGVFAWYAVLVVVLAKSKRASHA